MASNLVETAAAAREQLLTLKVMRMSRPAFHEPVTMAVDPADPFASGIEKAVNAISGSDSMEFPVGECLMAPQALDNIYLGETFTFQIVVMNDSPQSCTEVSVKADLQTVKRTITLQSRLNDVTAELAPGKFLSQVATHEIKETGQHILICSVSYKTPDNEKMYFRKFFKFPVNPPIDVRTKFYNAEDNLNNDVYLEAQIRNLCPSAIVLEKVTLDAVEAYICREIRPPASTDEVGNVYLPAKSVRQYLFCLTPNTSDNSLVHYRGLTTIGKLDMCWRSSMGEKGRLQTSALSRVTPGHGELRLTIEQIPGMVPVLQPFVISCKLYNCSERPLDLVLSLDGSLQPDIVFCSTSGQHLGQVAPSKTVQFSLNAFATAAGLKSISGLRITDTFFRRTNEHDEVAQIFVH
uniref:Trafficking protein particle complex subunit 13 n=1 Tax=Panagrellus redivivus TaxID=6233 RepID=A0A7E4W704_PANRE